MTWTHSIQQLTFIFRYYSRKQLQSSRSWNFLLFFCSNRLIFHFDLHRFCFYQMNKNITFLLLFLQFNYIALKMIFLNHTVCLHPYNLRIGLSLVKIMWCRKTFILILIGLSPTNILLFTQYLLILLLKCLMLAYYRCHSTMLYINFISIFIFFILFRCLLSQKFIRILLYRNNLFFISLFLKMLKI